MRRLKQLTWMVRESNIVTNDTKRDSIVLSLYFLNIFCKDSNRKWKKKASIYLGNKVLLKVEEDTDYYLVAIGHLDFSKGFPPKLKLASRQAFSIEKVL